MLVLWEEETTLGGGGDADELVCASSRWWECAVLLLLLPLPRAWVLECEACDDDANEEEEEESEDDESTPRRGFHARLQKLRSSSGKGKGKAKAVPWSSDDSSDGAMSIQMTWASEDEDYYDHIEVSVAWYRLPPSSNRQIGYPRSPSGHIAVRR